MDNNLAQYMLRPVAMMAQPGGRAYIVVDSKYEENVWNIQDDVVFVSSCKRPLTPDVPGNKIATRDEVLYAVSRWKRWNHNADKNGETKWRSTRCPGYGDGRHAHDVLRETRGVVERISSTLLEYSLVHAHYPL